MEGLYSGMSAGFGFLLFFIILSFIWLLFNNYKKRKFSQNRPVNAIDLADEIAEEERKEQRIDIVWPASIKTGNRVIKAKTKDLSRGGAFLKCNEPLAPGEQFHLIIEIPEKDSIVLNSEVIWSNCNIPEEKVVNRGMGVRFIKNNDEDLVRLKNSLEEYREHVMRTTGSPANQFLFI